MAITSVGLSLLNPLAEVVIVAGSPATFVRVHTSKYAPSYQAPLPIRFVQPDGVEPIWPDVVAIAMTHRSPTFAAGKVIVTAEPVVFEKVVNAETNGPLFETTSAARPVNVRAGVVDAATVEPLEISAAKPVKVMYPTSVAVTVDPEDTSAT
ncbi:hypothetical protein ACF057_08960 [Rhodococcus erythropolis]